MPWAAIIAGVIAFIKALFGVKPKDPITVEKEHEATVAEKQAAIVADHTRLSAADSMRDGSF